MCHDKALLVLDTVCVGQQGTVAAPHSFASQAAAVSSVAVYTLSASLQNEQVALPVCVGSLQIVMLVALASARADLREWPSCLA